MIEQMKPEIKGIRTPSSGTIPIINTEHPEKYVLTY